MDGNGQIRIFSLFQTTPNLDGHITAKKIPLKVSDCFISIILKTAMVMGKSLILILLDFITKKYEFNSGNYII